MQFETIDEEGNEVVHELPHKNEICPRCDGYGAHVNPNVDPFEPDCEEDLENYIGGVYDIRCLRCNGNKIIQVVDEAKCDKTLLKEYLDYQEDLRQHRAEQESERRMGA